MGAGGGEEEDLRRTVAKYVKGPKYTRKHTRCTLVVAVVKAVVVAAVAVRQRCCSGAAVQRSSKHYITLIARAPRRLW